MDDEYRKQMDRMGRGDRWVWWIVGAVLVAVIAVLVWTAGPADDGAYDDAPPSQPVSP